MHNSVLVISDLHIPYHHKDSFRFLKAIKKEFKPDTVINIGDLLDFHAISMHEHNPDLPSAGQELDIAREYVKELEAILKPYGDFLGTRKWKWIDDITLKLSNGKKCFFTHGRAADILKVSQTMGMSAVQGHYHTKFVISYWANPDDIFFGMNVGCLINQKSMAFSYAKNFRTRFILGCGIILNGIPRLLPMVLDKNGNWIGEIV